MTGVLSKNILDHVCCIKSKSKPTGQNLFYYDWPWQATSKMEYPQRRKNSCSQQWTKSPHWAGVFGWLVINHSKGLFAHLIENWLSDLLQKKLFYCWWGWWPRKEEKSHPLCVSSDLPQVASHLIHVVYCLLLLRKSEHDNQFNWANIDFFFAVITGNHWDAKCVWTNL